MPIPAAIQTKRYDATYSISLAPESLFGRQEILNASSTISGLVLRLDDGLVVASLINATNCLELAAPWPASPDVFVTATVVVSTDRAALYLDGREAAAAELPQPVSLLPRRWSFPVSFRYPFRGVVNDMVVWSRALRPDEVRRLCGSRRDIRRQYAPLASRFVPVARAVTEFVFSMFRVFSRLVPARRGPAVMRRDCPIVALHTTKADDRHFVRSHEKSLFNGYRTKKAANLRQIDLFYDGHAYKAEAGLDDTYGGEFVCRRQAFVVKGDIPELLGSTGVARLYPPEAHVLLHPDAPDILPLNARYVRLYEDKAFKGLYVIEPFDAPGSAWMARGDTHRALYFGGRPRPSDIPPSGTTSKVARNAAQSLVLSDSLFPWSAAELAIRRRRHRAAFLREGFKDFKNTIAPIDAIIGDNPAPMFIVGDLSLSAAGADIVWTSSDSDIISPTGAVHRPNGRRHRTVMLAATSVATGASQKYRFRVMARERTLPTLFLNIGALPTKEVRNDFTATLIPEDGSAPVVLSGLAGTGGGLRHRGNTSYINGVKRSFSLKFDTPVNWPDLAHPARHVILHSGYSDPTRLKNKICFDAFRAAFAKCRCPIPVFSACELFVNGEWMGVWECSNRVRDLLPEGSLLYKIRGFNKTLWRVPDTSMLDCIVHPEDMDADPYAPISELFNFTANSTQDQFVKGVESRFYMDNLLGYQLMLMFSSNTDAVLMNQFFARLPDDSRFIIVPWDYDKTFLHSRRHLRSHLLYRLATTFPDFKARLATRWSELRAGDLSNKALFSRFDADVARLAPYMADEWRLLAPAGFSGSFDDAIATLRDAIRHQLAFMDETFAVPLQAK